MVRRKHTVPRGTDYLRINPKVKQGGAELFLMASAIIKPQALLLVYTKK